MLLFSGFGVFAYCFIACKMMRKTKMDKYCCKTVQDAYLLSFKYEEPLPQTLDIQHLWPLLSTDETWLGKTQSTDYINAVVSNHCSEEHKCLASSGEVLPKNLKFTICCEKKEV